MKKRTDIFAAFLVAILVAIGGTARAATYYVSSSAGNDSNNGTSPATPWATLRTHVNGGSFTPGDVIYLKRGDAWNEQLIPPSNGLSGSPIQFDAYGTGAAPVITGAAPIAFATGSWTYDSGNTWRATIATTITSATADMVRFGNVYGAKRTGASCASVITSKYDWCVSWPVLYVYSPAAVNPTTTYAAEGSIVPIIGTPTGLQMVYVNGKSWLTFQHIKVQMFDFVGVGVAGAADNLVFANMESDGMVPYGTTPHGFYVYAANPANIQFLNDDAHLNYDGFHFSGTATAITMTNCRGYANREAGLKDGTGHATYSYSHFYGNNIAQLATGDVVGGIAGIGNISSAVAPVVVNFAMYPARFSFTVDDVGSSVGTEAYINTFLPTFSARGVKFDAAVVPSYAVDWASVNRWYELGHDINSHSWSHQYYTTNPSPQNATPYPNAPALKIQYTGSGTAASLSIAGGMLTTTVTGTPADNLNITLASYNNQQLVQYLNSVGHYSAQRNLSGWPLDRDYTHASNFLNVSNQDIKTSSYTILYDQTKLLPDEMLSSKSAIQGNVPGLNLSFYVYPDGLEDPTTEVDAVTAGYTAARGSLAMKGQDNVTASANSVYASGVNVQNITSLAVIQLHGMSRPQIDALAASLVFRAAAWGAPYGLFTHYNSRGDLTPDISNVELGYLLDAITANGGVWMTNTAVASAVTAGANLGGTTRWVQGPSGAAVNLAVAGAGSPTVGRGAATGYPVDLGGVNRTTVGAWDIGASVYLSQRHGTGGGSGVTTVR